MLLACEAVRDVRDGRRTAGRSGPGGLPPGVRVFDGLTLLAGRVPATAAAPAPKAPPKLAPKVVPAPRPVAPPKTTAAAAGAGRLSAGRGASSPAQDWADGVALMVRLGAPRAEAERRLALHRPELRRAYLIAKAAEARRAIGAKAEAERCGWCVAAAKVAAENPALIADYNQAKRAGVDGGAA